MVICDMDSVPGHVYSESKCIYERWKESGIDSREIFHSDLRFGSKEPKPTSMFYQSLNSYDSTNK